MNASGEHAPKPTVQDVYPLAPLQEGLLFHGLRDPGKGLYCVQAVWDLRGVLTKDILDRAWKDLARAHPVLRTAFSWRHGGRPVQAVLEDSTISSGFQDWRSLDDSTREERLRNLLIEDRSTDFDLSRPPLARLQLIAWAPNSFRLIWTYHHILMDGWSWAIVAKDFLEAIDAHSELRQPMIRPRKPFRDYIDWIARQDVQDAREVWRAQLEGLAGPTYLSTRAEEKPEQALATMPEVRFTWTAAEQEALRAYAKREGVTLNTLIQAAWARVLSQFTRQTDVVFGSTTANRPADIEGADELVGLLINTVPVRLDVSGAMSPDRLRNFQRQQAALRRQSFLSLADITALAPTAASDGLFNTIVVFENYPGDTLLGKFGEHIEVAGFELYDKTNYPLTLVVLPGKTFEVRARYDAQHHNKADVETLLRALRAASLALVNGAPEAKPAATTSSRRVQGRGTGHSSLAAAFRAQARNTPDAIAVTFDGENATYASLDRLSTRVAIRLAERGVQPGALVGLCAKRSLDTVAAILGILKAGAAYVPLDPHYPRDRIAFVLSDCRCPVVVTSSEDRALVDGCDAKVLLLEDLLAAGQSDDDADEPGSRLPAPDSDRLAYVIYTSGSTGNPKGVKVTHANVLRLFTATEQWFGFGQDDVWTLFHSFAFDFSVWELWGPLLYGGRLVIVPHWTTRDAGQFRELLVAERVTVLNQTPSAFKQLIRVDSGQPASDLGRLRYVVFGGEALDFASLREWIAIHGDDMPQLINMYGITETTVHVTWHRVTRREVEHPIGSVIGVPIPDLDVYLWDQDLQAVPDGVPGEIVVGGAGVAEGYLNREQLTAERFVVDPADPASSRRLYRSGDIGRRLPDGTLEYLGRVDNQVKIRGFRIEPGEIEHVLMDHQAIAEVAVLACEKETKERFLAAYYVPRATATIGSGELRDWLRGQLPEHMIPEVFIDVERFPLTENGKLDRKRLPAPVPRESRANAKPPSTETERRLAEIWVSLTGRSEPGTTDNFFDVGGNSILSMQLAARVGKEFGKEVPVVTIYECPTIEKLAAYLAGEIGEKNVHDVARERAGRRSAARRPVRPAKVTNDG